jgi:hypothetical protein
LRNQRFSPQQRLLWRNQRFSPQQQLLLRRNQRLSPPSLSPSPSLRPWRLNLRLPSQLQRRRLWPPSPQWFQPSPPRSQRLFPL